jgi:hypothetical protein
MNNVTRMLQVFGLGLVLLVPAAGVAKPTVVKPKLAKKAKVQPPPSVATTLRFEARIHSFDQYAVIVSVPISGKAVDKAKKFGARIVSQKDQIRPGAIYDGRYYVRYALAEDGPSPAQLRRRQDQDVRLVLERDEAGTNRVKTFLKGGRR